MKSKFSKPALLAPLVLAAVGVFVFVARPFAQNGDSAVTGLSGTIEKLNVAHGVVTMLLDAPQFGSENAKQAPLEFSVSPGSFFSAVVFNSTFRAADGGALGLVPAGGKSAAPAALAGSAHELTLEKLPLGERFEYALRNAQTGFVYFNVERFDYRYDAGTHGLRLENARLLFSPEFAKQLGDPKAAETEAGSIAFSIAMYPIEVIQLENGASVQTSLPARRDAPEVGTHPGPDVIVGDMPSMVQSQGSAVNNRVGLAIATTSCNAGTMSLNWVSNPSNDHPVIPQNLYRMNGGADNAERFEQIGQGWMKHAFAAVNGDACGFGCGGSGSGLRSGCSDPYSTGLNGSQTGIGSRAWTNPFTGFYPRNDSPTPNNNHSGHTHDVTTHRVLVHVDDLNTTLNPGASYFGETQYVTPHEYAWCQGHPGECNMYNNASYRRFNVGGSTPSFTFAPAAATVREQPAIFAWTGATRERFEPAPGADGIGFIAYRVSGPTSGVYHYEYVVYNENLDRAIQSFSVPLGCGAALTNIGFKAPVNHPGTPNDGTLNSAGYSNTPWASNQTMTALSWNTETFAQNQNANAIRWGTAYTFRFDSMQAPTTAQATVGFFKTGSPVMVPIQAPSAGCAPLQMVSGVSRKMHGAAGEFDVPLQFTGPPAVESRRGGANGDHTLVFIFSNDVVSGNATVTPPGSATISGTPVFSGNRMTLNLTGAVDAGQTTVTLSNVTDTFGQTLPDTAAPLGFLMGDVNGDGEVNAGDVLQTRNRSGQTLDANSFRSDVNTDGDVNSGDASIVRSQSGRAIEGFGHDDRTSSGLR